jgi:CelD/BcsL family acetyltransferase involved in cellulose biosynthesis
VNVRFAIRPYTDALGEEWEALARRTLAPPFLFPGWVLAWCRAFGRTLRVAECRAGHDLLGVLPLIVSALGSARTPADWHTPVAGSVTAGTDAAKALASALAGRRFRRLVLWPLDPADPLVDAVRAASIGGGVRILHRQVFASPFVDTGPGWGAYERTIHPKSLRETVRRRRRLAERGRVALDVRDGSDGFDALDALLEEGFSVEAAGWKGDRGTSIASSPATERFYRDIARWSSSLRWLRLAFLRVDETAIAFDLCLEAGGVHYLVKTGYRPEWSRFAPGMVLRLEMIRRAFDLGLDRYEFLGGESEWKRVWTHTSLPRLRVEAFDRTAAGTAEWAAQVLVRPVARRAAVGVRGLARRGRAGEVAPAAG